MKQRPSRWLVTLLFCSVALLASCAHVGPRYGAANNQPTLSANDYIQLAAQSQGAKKQEYLLLAADRLTQDRKIQAAENLLNDMSDSVLTPAQQVEKQILQAQLQLSKHQPDQAFALLNQAAASNTALANNWQVKLHQLLADTYQAQGNYLASITQEGEALALLPSNAREANLLQTWESLQSLSPETLQNLQQQATTPYQHGWLSLVLISNQTQNSQSLLQALKNWQQQYPNHPARVLLANIQSSNIALHTMPKRIALLLPTTGPLAKQGNAIRNGFFAAYYSAKKQGYTPTITVFNTNSGDINTIYQKAVQQGADFVVGPLTKANLTKLVNTSKIQVPTLALNTLSANDDKILNLYQFGLSPIDEARQAAVKAYNDHHTRALIIAPTGPWGASIAKVFQQTWESLGGRTITQLNYSHRDDFNKDISQLLNIDQSKSRERNLHYVLREKIRTVPRRRKDFDTIFLVAGPAQAREILPLLKFYYAGNVPVYATSLIYPGIPQPNIDHDLNGVVFDDMPWVLKSPSQLPTNLAQTRHRIKILWPRSYAQNTRLYGLGVDAYDIIPRLGKLAILPQFGVYSATGMLYLSPNQHIYRKLVWAQMIDGKPELLQGT
ncbi:penicillin-binding protein activator [Candidiatus Paracoxiella cheracis]|uniref:penicillin-binding protein activator n=1 Tax=Candidiatus Paracoxiella cheracis TaxID=3405120 RepID=UPI003BF49411